MGGCVPGGLPAYAREIRAVLDSWEGFDVELQEGGGGGDETGGDADAPVPASRVAFQRHLRLWLILGARTNSHAARIPRHAHVW